MRNEEQQAEFTFKNKKIPVTFTVGKAISFKADFNINLLNLFEDNNLDLFGVTVALNDEKMIDVWWHFVSEHFKDREECINELTRDKLTEFKEAFWAAVVNFTDPAGKPILLELKKQLPELLKRQAVNQLNQPDQK